ncbi:MAG: helix-turn-helix domain-containing protein [Actinomycetota bacterium]|nr:helix-turn-helix domain-containing protein [Actinomycetota bacterium]
MATAELLLHPVRLRIVRAFLGDRALTTSQLAAELADVPTGSLYRHVGLLAKEGVLQVVAEQRVRGAVERTYVLRVAAAQVQPDEIAAMTPEDHAQAFMAFTAGLLADFDRYLAGQPTDPGSDGVGYRLAALWLTDGEYADFLRDLIRVVQPRAALPPTGTRRRRLLYGVALPDRDAAAPPAPAASPAKAARPARRPRPRPRTA